MSFRSSLVSAAALCLLATAVPILAPSVITAASAAAEKTMPFDQAAFDAAQKADKPILVHITAPWCSTCAAQKPIVGHLQAEPKFKDLVTFNVDFDSQKALVRKFGATMQSTLIVFKGAKEEGRSSGETRAAPIAALLGKAV